MNEKKMKENVTPLLNRQKKVIIDGTKKTHTAFFISILTNTVDISLRAGSSGIGNK